MDLDISSQRISVTFTDKGSIFETIIHEIKCITEWPVETLENKLSNLLPQMNSLLLEIYRENISFNTNNEQREVKNNLMMIITLIDGLQDILEHSLSSLDSYDILSLKSLYLWLPICFDITYKHCKENQKHYQNIMVDCKEILELYKKNQECYMKFLNNLIYVKVNYENFNSVEVFLKVINYLSRVITSLFEMLNIKALADSWKGYCNVVEKHYEIFSKKGVYVSSIEMITLQIRSFMERALGGKDDKQRIQYIKLSGFLMKVLMKIMLLFWEQLSINYLRTVHKTLCTIYNYSYQFLGKWDLDPEIKSCIQTCLFDVVTPFVSEKVLTENFLKHLYTNSHELEERSEGCLIMDLKVVEYIRSQQEEIDYVCFEDVLAHLFEDVSLFFSEFHNHSCNKENSLMSDLCNLLSGCIITHSEFYNEKTERILFENVIGNSIYCHSLAKECWIRILGVARKDSKEKIVKKVLQSVEKLQIDVVFVSKKTAFLQNFTQRIFSILDEDGKNSILEMYPPDTHLHLWRIIGFGNISSSNKIYIEPLLHLLFENLRSFENSASGHEMIETLEVAKMISCIDRSVLQFDYERIISSLLNLWDFNYEVVDLSNVLLGFIIRRLFHVTINLINSLSTRQLIDVLQKIKKLLSSSTFKIQLCCLLDVISTKETEHSVEQNKLNSVISDLFEILLTDNNITVKELSLETFQRFVNNNHYIIVNNVSRMLPNMNLNQLHDMKLDNIEVAEYFNRIQGISFQHKCLRTVSSSKENNFIRTPSLYSDDNDNLFEPVQVNSKKTCLGIRSNRLPQNHNKRIKLTDDQDDDTIKEIVLRMKHEIKCLNKVLLKDRMTQKNIQEVRQLINQLQNTLEST